MKSAHDVAARQRFGPHRPERCRRHDENSSAEPGRHGERRERLAYADGIGEHGAAVSVDERRQPHGCSVLMGTQLDAAEPCCESVLRAPSIADATTCRTSDTASRRRRKQSSGLPGNERRDDLGAGCRRLRARRRADRSSLGASPRSPRSPSGASAATARLQSCGIGSSDTVHPR